MSHNPETFLIVAAAIIFGEQKAHTLAPGKGGAMAATQRVAREKNGILATCATDFEGFWQGTRISTKNVTQLVPCMPRVNFSRPPVPRVNFSRPPVPRVNFSRITTRATGQF
ncbi:hypothetical protein DFH08DRAFT_808389 [Mycena albidolilacea]|uniref:Uncharacterized protein n=1 Tax=Mycena albidolilacea TaxID=1033008 RepID=A0AAD6Z144_9AGAR|nr:hypothetical protein DFH08DRAFT_826372 [Mycena albidolilacea]KAJ7348661.1 hypothetical protein DFH08DRAFT_808389 [Mycena albidolilacea]